MLELNQKLVPRTFTVESTFKPYGESPLGNMSSGSTFGMSLDLGSIDPVTVSWADLKRELLEVKEQMDLLALTAEYAKGALTTQRYQAYKDRIKLFYDKMLKRGENVEPVGPKAGD